MNNQTVTVTLPTPFEKGDKTITEIELRKPNAGNLRGLSLIGVCEMQFDAACTLLPRISILNERDLLNMEVENLAPLMTEIASFFVDMKQ
ncbi:MULTISPECIES: phage tail assembly protein [Aliivibrio]|uniref:phage tail assembly protein n=1 Tax=Aliivibrio TaxID=511678 RepID=UPI00080ECD31|nr:MULTISPECIES: phage tail assembly protein [Aliivibrio]MBD1567963.1 phage tail assembly protein [Aliivibrio sp. S10_S31]OCH43717.1 phage tail protein [Aliivibrio fischeri]OED52896.1 phage tail protein [Aliivibrio fischeri]